MDSIFIKEEDIGDSDIDILADSSIRSDDPMELSRFTTDNSSFDDDSKANIDRLKEELEESLNNQEERDTSWEQSSSSRPKEKKKEKSKKEIEEEEREKMQVLVSNFTEDQLNHYEMFRRAAFPKAAIKRTIMTLRRAPNFSEAEEVLLVDLVKNMPILNSFKTDAASSQLKNEAWLEVEELFNAKSATPRSASALREKYKGLKKRLKRKLADDKLEVTKTGGGRAASDVPLSEAENALAASMGEILTGLQSRVGVDKEIARTVSPDPIPIENLESVPSPEDFSDDPTPDVTHHRPDPLNHPEMSQQLPSQLSSDFERPLASLDLTGCAAHTTKTKRTYSPADMRSSPSRRLRGTVKRADLRDKISSWAAIKEQTARFNFTKEMAQEMHNAKITNMMEKHHQEMAMMREKHEEEMAHIKAIHELELKWTREKMYTEKKILEEKRQQTN